MMEKLKRWLENHNRKLLILLGLTGILLLFLPTLLPESETETPSADDPARQIEARLETLIAAIDGAGETQVMVTLSDTGSRVYLYNTDRTEEYADGVLQSRHTEGEYLTAGGSTVLQAERPPAVEGVAVVCRGGDSAGVQSDIYEVLYALYGLSSARVSIEKMR